MRGKVLENESVLFGQRSPVRRELCLDHGPITGAHSTFAGCASHIKCYGSTHSPDQLFVLTFPKNGYGVHESPVEPRCPTCLLRAPEDSDSRCTSLRHSFDTLKSWVRPQPLSDGIANLVSTDCQSPCLSRAELGSGYSSSPVGAVALNEGLSERDASLTEDTSQVAKGHEYPIPRVIVLAQEGSAFVGPSAPGLRGIPGLPPADGDVRPRSTRPGPEGQDHRESG